jgi:predicted lipid-binding transport protein (Tim44 family)
MSGWTDVVMSHMYPWPIGVLVSASAVSLIFGVIGIWSLLRVRQLLRVVPAVEDRLNTLANSVSMLTDTTESCFKALAMQLQYEQAQARSRPAVAQAAARSRAQSAAEPPTEAATRKSRQRRVVGAARRGEALADIAAREDVAEGEVALRLHVNRDPVTPTETKRYGSMLT